MTTRTRIMISGAALGVMVCWSLAVSAQMSKKLYTEWSDKEAVKVLNESAWGQTQVYSDTSKMFYNNRQMESGDTRIADVAQFNFRIRFLGAKPIRQALCRSMELQQKGELSTQMAERLKTFALAETPFPDYIVVTVAIDSAKTSSPFQEAAALFSKLTTMELKTNTYLLVKGGQRVFLKEYQAPRGDGFGARFIFPRIVDGKPFITPESGEVQFYSELNSALTLDTTENNKPVKRPVFLNMRYKVKDMMYDGKLEY